MTSTAVRMLGEHPTFLHDTFFFMGCANHDVRDGWSGGAHGAAGAVATAETAAGRRRLSPLWQRGPSYVAAVATATNGEEAGHSETVGQSETVRSRTRRARQGFGQAWSE